MARGIAYADDPETEYRVIIQKFMKELCKRDDEDNRGRRDPDRPPNVFPTKQIQEEGLGAFSLEHVIFNLRRHLQENRDNEPFDFLDNEVNVRLTNAGRARCDEYGL
ncbi:MAG: hypothetical protein WBZ36_12265 [Candidatus Nitrosopolaris sp.]